MRPTGVRDVFSPDRVEAVLKDNEAIACFLWGNSLHHWALLLQKNMTQ